METNHQLQGAAEEGKANKAGVMDLFCTLNEVVLIQLFAFVKMRIESNVEVSVCNLSTLGG